MSFWSAVPFIGTLLDKIGKFLPDKQKLSEAQAKINEQEIAGAPASRLRLSRMDTRPVLRMGSPCTIAHYYLLSRCQIAAAHAG